MKTSPLRAIAALALLCLLPRASALTVSYSNSALGGFPTSYNSGAFSIDWLIPQFDPGLGTLVAVDIAAVFTTTVGTAEANHYPPQQSITYTPHVFHNATIAVDDLNFLPASIAESAFGATQNLAPGQWSSPFSATFTAPVAINLGTGDPLHLFVGSTTHRALFIDRYGSNSFFGTTGGTVTIEASVMYTYNAPDAGATFGTFFTTMIVVIQLHRLRKRLPTL